MQETSLLAYEKIAKKLGERERMVFEGFKRFGPCTDYELCRFLGFSDPNMVRPRRKSLSDSGLIRLVGQRKDGYTGNKALVWAC